MHLHILGICGTFMGGIASLAKALGHRVTGCDANVYPPMSTQLETEGIELVEGFGVEQLSLQPDLFVIGNALSRGNKLVEAILNQNLPYTSGPQWLADHLLIKKQVIAVSGTHGKTTTSSMAAWILEFAGLQPGFLIGGVPSNFNCSARSSSSQYFVVEADEYDSAFFDKRSKFIHYRPHTLIINNLEYDHADIFPDLAAIQRQFHHLVRTVPSEGLLILPAHEQSVTEVIAAGCWTPAQKFGISENKTVNTKLDWQANLQTADGGCFDIYHRGKRQGSLAWSLTGHHNVYNALAAIAAAFQVGVSVDKAIAALEKFKGVKRRLELLAEIAGIAIYDDFAHHPTAIATTLLGMRQKINLMSQSGHVTGRLWAIIEPGSNTMRMGVHSVERLRASVTDANSVIWFQPKRAIEWQLEQLVIPAEQAQVKSPKAIVMTDEDELVTMLMKNLQPGDQVVFMSNSGGLKLIQQLLLDALRT